MANAAGVIYERIWRDPEWRQVSRSAQALYMQLLSQKELDCAGVLPLQPEKWAKGCDELTVPQVWEDLGDLQARRFVYFDLDTYEAFIRTYMRNSNVMKVPNMLKSARRAALLVGSEVIKPILAEELRATGDQECAAIADQINPSVTVPEPFPNPSNWNPSGTLPEGSGVGMGKGLTHLGNNSGGEEPRPVCAKHKNGNAEDENCRGCMKIRIWEENQSSREEANELDERRRQRDLRDNCPLCDENGLVETRFGMRRCDHQEAAHA